MYEYCSRDTSEGMNGIMLKKKVKIEYTGYIGFRHLKTEAVESLRVFVNSGVITAFLYLLS